MNRASVTRSFRALTLGVVSLAMFAACNGSGSSTGGLKTGGDFVVLSTEPNDNALLFLNDAIRIDFSNEVDLTSVDRNSFSFVVRDQIGNIVAEPVAGSFQIGTSPGDGKPGRRLLFVPRLPTNDLYTNGGFRPGRTYEVQLVGGNPNNQTVIRDTAGKPLALPRTFRFSTADGTTPAALFRNTAAGGPQRAAFEVSPRDASGVVLNKLGAPSVEVRLRFDQPLNPNSTNVPVAINTNPLTRNSNSRGRIFLQYDDPTFGIDQWIPADVELESNEITGAVVVLRPLGVLPNNATIEVIVANTLEDISGESNAASVSYEERFGTFETRRAYEQQFDGLVEDFLDTSNVDLTAAFSEPVAEIGDGFIKAGFDFEGTVTGADFEPTAPMTVLNTDFTLVTPSNGSPFNVSGGVFNFRNVTIPAGRTVRGQGTNPMVWLCSGTFTVAGTLSVQGENGRAVSSAGTANEPKEGGAGVCGGGDGGDGSPSATGRDLAGANGRGPLQVANGGGRGGQLSSIAGCSRGAGGGGGALATQGDPNYKLKTIAAGTVPLPPPNNNINNVFPIFPQQTGQGGNGCVGVAGGVTRVLEGSVAGGTVFTDARNDNNFWGVGVRYDTNLRIAGELSVPLGGGGGGGGGDLSYNATGDIDDPNFQNDSSGGGGGGGGGVLIVKCLGPIVIADGGRITADGGMGGGGEPLSASLEGGGGGGGAGGMVVLMSAEKIVINARGTGTSYRYQTENNYDFSISADGGVTITGQTPPVVLGKYPGSGTAIPATFANTYDSVPLGGFGGMGIVQLMAPPGEDNADLTNTVLDDNIEVRRAGQVLNGLAKQQMLAWRGFPNSFGQGVDDDGDVINPTNADNEGDIRPAPVLLPTPFSTKSRVRSIWVDTGATARRGLLVDDDLPRGIVEQNGAQRGPLYTWSGTRPNGYLDFDLGDGGAVLKQDLVVSATPILTRDANATFLDSPAYRVQLSQSALGTTNDRFVQYEAELIDGTGELLASYRILSHTGNELLLSPESGALNQSAGFLQVREKFFAVVTDGQLGLGSTYNGSGGSPQPNANIRIGFAFHQNPGDPTALRFPADEGTFYYDLSPTVLEEVRSNQASFVQWDILFDLAFKEVQADSPQALNPESNRPALQFLRLPFRF